MSQTSHEKTDNAASTRRFANESLKDESFKEECKGSREHRRCTTVGVCGRHIDDELHVRDLSACVCSRFLFVANSVTHWNVGFVLSTGLGSTGGVDGRRTLAGRRTQLSSVPRCHWKPRGRHTDLHCQSVRWVVKPCDMPVADVEARDTSPQSWVLNSQDNLKSRRNVADWCGKYDGKDFSF